MIELLTKEFSKVSPLTIQEVGAAINNRRFGLSDLGISKRVFLHWRKSNLFPLPIIEEKRTKLHFLDLIWGKIIIDLREIGMSLEKIKKIKDLLFEPFAIPDTYDTGEKDVIDFVLSKLGNINLPEEQKIEFEKMLKTKEGRDFLKSTISQIQISWLEVIFYNTIILRNKNSLMIFPDGRCVPIMEDYRYLKEYLKIKPLIEGWTYIHISLVPYITNFLFDNKNEKLLPELKFITIDELTILKMLKGGELKSITIKFENDSPKIIEVTSQKEIQDSEIKSIITGITSSDYQSIEIKTNNNKKLFFQRTEKKKL